MVLWKRQQSILGCSQQGTGTLLQRPWEGGSLCVCLRARFLLQGLQPDSDLLLPHAPVQVPIPASLLQSPGSTEEPDP